MLLPSESPTLVAFFYPFNITSAICKTNHTCLSYLTCATPHSASYNPVLFFSQTVSISNTVSPFLCPFTTPSNSTFLLFFFMLPFPVVSVSCLSPLHHYRLSHGPAFRWVLQRAVKTLSVVHAAPACPASTGTPRRRSPRCCSESPTDARATLCPPLVCGWAPA